MNLPTLDKGLLPSELLVEPRGERDALVRLASKAAAKTGSWSRSLASMTFSSPWKLVLRETAADFMDEPEDLIGAEKPCMDGVKSKDESLLALLNPGLLLDRVVVVL